MELLFALFHWLHVACWYIFHTTTHMMIASTWFFVLVCHLQGRKLRILQDERFTNCWCVSGSRHLELWDLPHFDSLLIFPLCASHPFSRMSIIKQSPTIYHSSPDNTEFWQFWDQKDDVQSTRAVDRTGSGLDVDSTQLCNFEEIDKCWKPQFLPLKMRCNSFSSVIPDSTANDFMIFIWLLLSETVLNLTDCLLQL